MAVTKEEYLAKKQIMDILSKQGYPTYAHLLDFFDLNLTNDPSVVGYMIPERGVIVLNRNLDISQVSTIVRHEILHEYLSHQLRMQRHLGKDAYDKRTPSLHQLINIAGDYEISNRGYTEKDKDIVRAIKLNGELLKGLVTEDDHPDWVDLTIEEMFDKLYDEYKQNEDKLKELMDMIQKLNQQGDENIQKAEEIAREAADISSELDDSSDSGDDSSSQSNSSGKDADQDNNSSSNASPDQQNADQNPAGEHQKGGSIKNLDDLADKAKEISKEASKAKNAAEQSQDDAEENVFSTPEDRAKQVAISKKLTAIEKAFTDLKDQLEAEDAKHLEKDKAIKADRELKRYKANPITNFKLSLYDLIKRQVAIKRDYSWSRPNRRYSGTGIIAPGKAIKPNPIPSISVYFDVSGSVHPYVETTRAALSVVKNFLDRGLIKVKVYYVSTIISDNENDSTGGGADGDLIMNNIMATKPDNVIIMTDGDADGTYSKVTVPGGVYFLFPNKNYTPDGLVSALHGSTSNKIFYLTSDDSDE